MLLAFPQNSPLQQPPIRQVRTVIATLLGGTMLLAAVPAHAEPPSPVASGIAAIATTDLAAIDAAMSPAVVAAAAAGPAAPTIALTMLPQGSAPPPVGPAPSEVDVTQADDDRLNDHRYYRDTASFGADLNAIKWEFAAVAGYYTAINAPKLFRNPRAPRFKSEGWFGRDTNNVGVDKLAHAYSSYIISELLYARLKHKTNGAPGIQVTAAVLASVIMAGSEGWDSIEPDGGWSWEDVAFNTLGAGFSVLRNSVPGLDRKLDFRLMIQPNEDIYTIRGKEHFRQQRYLFALKASGFPVFEKTPMRFVELHLGYRGDDFLLEDRAAGIVPKRHVFVGLGLNLRELLFKDARRPVGKAVGEVLDYFQVPYTAAHIDITE